MAEIAEGGGGDAKGGKKRAKKSSTRVDMTPMVDLAFLLLTFFVLTSTFSKPKIMSLAYPAKLDENEIKDFPPPEINNGITFLLTKDQIFYYKGEFKTGVTQLTETNFGPGKDGVRAILVDGNKTVIKTSDELNLKFQKGQIPDSIRKKELIKAKKLPTALKVLIKTDTKATCDNFIDLIDELKICEIGVIAPVDLMKDEETLLNQKIK